MTMTSQDVIKALRNRYDNRRFQSKRYILAEEVRAGRGFAGDYYDGNVGREIDLVVVDMYGDISVIGFEVKVSRSDFLADQKIEDKHTPALQRCNKYYFVCPKDMIKPDEIQPGIGLIYVDDKGNVREKVKSDINRVSLTPEFACMIMRRLV